MSYAIRETQLDHALSLCVKSWKECNARFPEHTIQCDPDWIAEHFKHSGSTVSNLEQLDFAAPWVYPRATNKENVRIYFLEKGGEIVGAVPFVLDQQQLMCGLGAFQVVKFPIRTLCLQSTHNMPAEGSAYDMLIGQILRSSPDAIYVSNVRTESFFWNYLHNSTLIRRWFQFYSRNGSLPHLLIRLDGTFESYMKKFSAKTRKNRFREIRRLRERGDLQLMRVSKASEQRSFALWEPPSCSCATRSVSRRDIDAQLRLGATSLCVLVLCRRPHLACDRTVLAVKRSRIAHR
jgi:hypothetical protein